MALWLHKQGCWKHQGRSNWHYSHSQKAQTGFPLLFNQIGWRKNVSDDLSWELITFQSWINNRWLQWWLSLKCAGSFGRMCWVAWVHVCALWVIWSLPLVCKRTENEGLLGIQWLFPGGHDQGKHHHLLIFSNWMAFRK